MPRKGFQSQKHYPWTGKGGAMFHLEVRDGRFRCDFPATIATRLTSEDVHEKKKLSKLLTRVEHLLGEERVHLSIMLPSLNLHLMDSNFGQIVIGCEVTDDGLCWRTENLSDGERIAASAYLATLAHLINLDLHKAVGQTG